MNFFYQIVRRLNIIILIILVMVFSFTMVFLYTNMYQTIIQAREVALLGRQVNDTAFNEKLWKQVIADIETKKNSANVPPDTNDPFNF